MGLKKKESNALKYHVKNAKDLKDYLMEKGKKHKQYKHYCRRDRLAKNLDNKCLYLMDALDWNDAEEKKNYRANSNGKKRYGLCFSYSTLENVAMWLVYCTLKDKEGLMMSLPNELVKDIINNTNSVTLGNFNFEGEFEPSPNEVAVNKGDIYLVDMYYLTPSAVKYRCSRAEEHADLENEVYEGTKQYSKIYPWHFENEVRMILELDQEIGADFSAAKIELSNEIVQKIKKEYLYEGPLNTSTDYNKSSLKGRIKI
jgi:hypothetical protein